NYRTFVEEIPQHSPTSGGALVDKFHEKNAYLIGLNGDNVVAMSSAHDEEPFSIAERLPDPTVLTSPGTRSLEVRLLAIEPSERNNVVLFFGLMYVIYEYARKNGYTHLFISAYSDRVSLYKKLGFSPLGPAVTGGAASFIPMVLKLDEMPLKTLRV